MVTTNTTVGKRETKTKGLWVCGKQERDREVIHRRKFVFRLNKLTLSFYFLPAKDLFLFLSFSFHMQTQRDSDSRVPSIPSPYKKKHTHKIQFESFFLCLNCFSSRNVSENGYTIQTLYSSRFCG